MRKSNLLLVHHTLSYYKNSNIYFNFLIKYIYKKNNIRIFQKTLIILKF